MSKYTTLNTTLNSQCLSSSTSRATRVGNIAVNKIFTGISRNLVRKALVRTTVMRELPNHRSVSRPLSTPTTKTCAPNSQHPEHSRSLSPHNIRSRCDTRSSAATISGAYGGPTSSAARKQKKTCEASEFWTIQYNGKTIALREEADKVSVLCNCARQTEGLAECPKLPMRLCSGRSSGERIAIAMLYL